jgi:hypothetical protein
MRKQKKHSRKYAPRQVIIPTTLQQREEWYKTTNPQAPLEDRQFAAGVIQHPVSGLYQPWISTNGLDVICVSAYYQQSAAEDDVQAFKALVTSGQIYDEEKTSALLEQQRQKSDEKPQPFPDDLVRQITRAILRRVVDQDT